MEAVHSAASQVAVVPPAAVVAAVGMLAEAAAAAVAVDSTATFGTFDRPTERASSFQPGYPLEKILLCESVSKTIVLSVLIFTIRKKMQFQFPCFHI